MERDELSQRLSQISTAWELLRRAHDGPEDQARAARQLLLERYGGAARRYLRALVHDREAAEELVQEFALDLVRGGFRGADPGRGRFRDYVKSALRHLVGRHRKRQRRQPRLLSDRERHLAELASDPADADSAFASAWRTELLERTWSALAEAQPPLHAVLRLRADHPDRPAEELARKLAQQFGKPVRSDTFRQSLHRARKLFAVLLVDEVAHSLHRPDLAQVEEELGELNLLEYCRPVLQSRNAGS